MQIQKLRPSFHERVWGSTVLEPWFPNPSQEKGEVKIGEVWFDSAPKDLPLVKFLFTTEKLSVQVHPDDEQARIRHNSPGKTEMWHILEAKPGAQIAIGFKSEITKEHARAAALSGEIEHLLQWRDVNAGETYFIPAGTVHAIGAGLMICEVQQRSDITYRFYDYGRDRELHLEEALAVAQLGPSNNFTSLPVVCEYFVAWPDLPASVPRSLWIVISGEGSIEGLSVRMGDVLLYSPDQPITGRRQAMPILQPAESVQKTGDIKMLTVFLPPAKQAL